MISREDENRIIQKVLEYIDESQGSTDLEIKDLKANPGIPEDIQGGSNMDTVSKVILQDFNFGGVDYAGAVKAGTVLWNQSTGEVTSGSGVAVYRGGIVGVNNGEVTFSLPITGSPFFKGEIKAGSSVIAGDITAGGTIEGVNIISSSSDDSIRLTEGDVLAFYKAGSMTGDITTNGGDLVLRGTDDVMFGAGGSIRVGVHGTAFRPTNNGIYDLGAENYHFRELFSNQVTTDKIDFGDFNLEQGSNNMQWSFGSATVLTVENDGDLKAAKNIKPEGTFKSSNGNEGINTSRDLITSIWASGNGIYKEWRKYTWESGILVEEGSTEDSDVCENCI